MPMVATSKKIIMEQDGQGLAEYALILALVALAAFAAFETLGGIISTKLDEVANSYP